VAKIKLARIEGRLTGSIQFSRNPSRGDYERRIQFLQPKDFSGGGDWYCYDHGIGAKKYKTLHFRNIPKTDLDNYLKFLENIAQGSRNNFLLFDYDAAGDYCGDSSYAGDGSYCYSAGVYLARIFNTEDICSKPVAFERESITIDLILEGG